MQAEMTSFWKWQQHFAEEKTCLQAIIKQRWPEDFYCPQCQYGKKVGCCKLVMFLNVQIAIITPR